MKTWKQEIAEALTPLEGVNAVTATLVFNITVVSGDPFGPTAGSTGNVRISRTVKVKGVDSVDKRLIDGKNYTSSDFVTELAYTSYVQLRKTLAGDPPIVNNGVVKSLDDMRPMGENYGIAIGEDFLTVGSDQWVICDVIALGLMDDDNGIASPAKLRLVLRKGRL